MTVLPAMPNARYTSSTVGLLKNITPLPVSLERMPFHALQGPIDDAFLDPFLMVRPTGRPWNDEVNQQALRSMARFDRLWGRFFRGHPFVKDDKDVTKADFARYHVVLFGDPGSNKWIAEEHDVIPGEVGFGHVLVI